MRDSGTPDADVGGSRRVPRRVLLLGTGAAAVAAAGVGGYLAGRDGDTPGPMPTRPSDSTPSRGAPVPATGTDQAGIARPSAPQPHGLFSSLDADLDSPAEVRQLLDRIGESILALAGAGARVAGVTDDGAGDLTITVGLGPRLVAAVDRQLPGAQALPRFSREGGVSARARGGDLLLAVQASDPAVLDPVRRQLIEQHRALSVRWEQQGFRGVGNGQPGVARNVIGYLDGIVIPRTASDLAADVWIADGAARNGTICVLRRFLVDVDRFSSQAADRQDQIVGRHRADGSPLSGGGPMDQVDLGAKTPDGRYLTPARSHVRAAHPSFTGSSLMLRGSYSFADTDGSRGLLFRCFQRDIETFVRTQRRLDEVDDLMGYTTLTATASFLVLPGFDADRPLGSSLFG